MAALRRCLRLPGSFHPRALRHFGTTQGFLREILALHRAEPVTGQLEVETYTWDVLPERYRQAEVGAAIARELNWVRGKLG